MERAEAPFEVQVHIEVIGIAPGVGPAHQKTLLVHHIEREAGAVFHQVGGRGVAQ